MTLTQIEPSGLQPGDPVIIDNTRMIIRAIDGPDHNQTYDLYLSSDCGDHHKVVRDPVAIVVHE